MQDQRIPVVDLFAGPGGLGEGFSRARSSNAFRLSLSVEMDPHAHRTLTLRAFVREFGSEGPPSEYFDYIAGRISRARLFGHFPEQAAAAQEEAWLAELGNPSSAPVDLVDEKMSKATGHNPDWILIGGPPCQAYSVIGRSRNAGNAAYDPTADGRHFLYREYLRMVHVHQPAVFVMENVPGILTSRRPDPNSPRDQWEPIFPIIRQDLEGAGSSDGFGYRLVPISAETNDANRRFLVRSELLGVPQRRHRVIVLGIRQDVYKQVSVRLQRHSSDAPTTANACKDLPASLLRLKDTKGLALHDAICDLPPLPIVISQPIKGWPDGRTAELRDSSDVIGFLRDDPLAGIEPDVARQMRTLVHTASSTMSSCKPTPSDYRTFVTGHFTDSKSVPNHEPRGHRPDDIVRYTFAAAHAKTHGRSPSLADFPGWLLPNHRNVQAAGPLQPKSGAFADRFRVQVADRPGTTVTSHISKDGHYYIHPDQARSFTVREAARVQSFPDDYYFEGPRTQQYRQVGNAVPPFLAYQIAEGIADLLGL